MPFPQCLPHTDRMDYVAAATNNQGFVVAMEKLLGISIPPRAAYIRMILAELQRLASHLVWLATHAIDIGAITPFFYTFRERDAILDLFEEYCGARLTLNTMRIGGVPYELPAGWVDRCARLDRRVPGPHRRVREPAHRKPDLEAAHDRGRRDLGRGRRRVGPDRPAAARLRGPLGHPQGVPLRPLRRGRVRHPDRRERRHLRPLPGAHGGDAAVGADHPAVPRPAARGAGDGQGAQGPALGGRHGLRRGRGAQGRARLLHRHHREGGPALPLPRPPAVVHQPAGAARHGDRARWWPTWWR